MTAKVAEKKLAIQLRREGKTYSEILAKVSVSKSTLSLWLRSVRLSTAQAHALTAKKRIAQQKGAERRREIRIQQTAEIYDICKQDIGALSDRELFILGVGLYWAEGTKKSGNRTDLLVDFANSDPAMIKLFVSWLLRCCKVNKNQVKLRLHLHESHRTSEDSIKEIWAEAIGLPVEHFTKTQYKIHTPVTVRYTVGSKYIGLVSVRVTKSTVLHRQIMGWIYAIIASKI